MLIQWLIKKIYSKCAHLDLMHCVVISTGVKSTVLTCSGVETEVAQNGNTQVKYLNI